MYARIGHRLAARRAAGVICVSESTAADVRRLWRVRPERITVASHGPGQAFVAAGGHAARHFLYVGDNEPRKNLGVLLGAYARYRRDVVAEPLPLVLAGSVSGVDEPGVQLEMRPDGERLGALYRDAVALVHPALHEGFGLTPLEAMRLGVPVIAAPSAGVREVCGDAARYADPRDPDAFRAAMVELHSSQALRAELAARGSARAVEFSWAKCADAHLAAYSLALER
jgi:glycosyltransferase involved in cell wall biosynthesis